MRRSLAGTLAITVLLAAVLAGGVSAKNQPGTTYADKTGGYQITIPTAWKLIPRSKAQVQALAASLVKKGQTNLASVYTDIVATPAGLSGLTAFTFQAFAWPVDTNTPLLTQVSVGVIKTSRAYTKKDLPSIGNTFAGQLATNKGAKVTMPVIVTLASGQAAYIKATIPAGTALQNGVALYLIPHGKRLYELSFQVDATLLSAATAKGALFTSIAENFKIT